jgi:chromosome segregation ATPase
MADDEGEGLRNRLGRQGEEALGKLASDLLENPLINSAITRAFAAREKAVAAQEAAMGALNLPSAADIERLTRRLRSVSNRIEGVEDGLERLQTGVDRLADRLEALSKESDLAERLDHVESQLGKLLIEVSSISGALDARPAPYPREQERLAVDDTAPKPAAKRRTASKRAAN